MMKIEKLVNIEHQCNRVIHHSKKNQRQSEVNKHKEQLRSKRAAYKRYFNSKGNPNKINH